MITAKAGGGAVNAMKRLKLTRERREDFLEALAETGIVRTAAEIAGTSRTRVYELRERDPAFAAGWDEAEEEAADALESEAWRRAVVSVHLQEAPAPIAPRFIIENRLPHEYERQGGAGPTGIPVGRF